MATLTCLCHLVYSRCTRYGLTVLSFSSEVGVQATQTSIPGDDDQEAVQNTFHRCLFLECRSHCPKSYPRRPQTLLSRKHSENVRPSMPIRGFFTRSSHVPAACPPSRYEASSEQQSPIDQDPSFVDYDLNSSLRVYVAS